MSLHDRILRRLLEEAHEPHGWLSDLQDAGLEVGEYDIYLNGEGYIDIDHLVSEVLMVLEEEET